MGEYWAAGKKLAGSDLKGFSCILVFIIDVQGLYSPNHLQIRVAIQSSEVLSSCQSRRPRVSDVGLCGFPSGRVAPRSKASSHAPSLITTGYKLDASGWAEEHLFATEYRYNGRL